MPWPAGFSRTLRTVRTPIDHLCCGLVALDSLARRGDKQT